MILTILLLVTIINFIDRQTLSILAPLLRSALHLTNQQYGRIVSLFQFGMLSGEFPMGYLMDRWGARLGLSFAVLWWSGATGAQIFARDARDRNHRRLAAQSQKGDDRDEQRSDQDKSNRFSFVVFRHDGPQSPRGLPRESQNCNRPFRSLPTERPKECRRAYIGQALRIPKKDALS